jgi:hypothetical protein
MKKYLKYLNNKGSALILVLSSLIILLAVGTVVTMLSAANITMSRKYSDWSKEYYWLDYAAQKRLSELDKNVLVSSENIARYYLQNGYYQYETVEDFPRTAGISSDVYTAFTSFGSLQPLLYSKWTVIDAIINDEDIPEEERQILYDNEMKEFIPNAFEVIYCACVNSGLGPVSKSDDPEGIDTSVTLRNIGWFPSISLYSSLEELHSAIDELPLVDILAWENSSPDPKQVKVEIEIIPPGFDAVQKTRYFAVKPNPLYSNALSVQGRIIFTGNGDIGIFGDVVSSNRSMSGNLLGMYEGNSDGIRAEGGADVTITGNVYSGGDLHITGSGSNIKINRYPAFYYDTLSLKRNLLYAADNRYFFDVNAAGIPNPKNYAEGETPEYIVPYIYQDSMGGNVYCNNLAIEKDITYSSIDISGNVWTLDDIQNDGKDGTSINIDGNYIGMRSTAVGGDHNASSAVINNARLFKGTVSIGGNYIIPGTSFYLFTGSGTDVYYQTAESVSAGVGEFFRIYVVEEDETGKVVEKTYYVSADEFYRLYEKELGHDDSLSLEDKMARFESYITGTGSTLNSYITVNKDAYGYILGTGVDKDGSIISSEREIENLNAFSEVKDTMLPNVFEAKTHFFGTNGMTFYDLVDEDEGKSDAGRGFYYYTGNATVNVSSVSSGILYCDGNLTLTGSGTFTGSVICSGDLTVHAGVNIVFSEEEVFRVLGFEPDAADPADRFSLLGSRTARRFFSPGEYTVPSIGMEAYTVLSTAGERKDGEISRYIINSWREMKKPAY